MASYGIAVRLLEGGLSGLARGHETFCGFMILLSGDFRQTLPVFPKSTAADELRSLNPRPISCNALDVPETPPHCLQLKVGTIIFILRNLNNLKQSHATRLSVNKIMSNVIQATTITGKFN